MSDEGLDDLIAPARPEANGSDPDLRAAAALAAGHGRQHHPDFDHPGPAEPDLVPDYPDLEIHPSDRPLELLRFDRLPTEAPPDAGVLYLPNGKGLFYENAVNSIAGDPGVGKTFAALLAVLAAITIGRGALLIDYEDTPGRLRARLLSLGVDPDLLELVHAVKDADRLWPTHVDQLTRYIEANDIAVTVIDSVTPAVEAHDLDENSGGDYSRWHRTVPLPLARAGTNAVIALDHRPKPAQTVRGALTRGLWAAGSRHKLAGIDGVAYILEARDAFSRATPGNTARLDLMVAKDRHGAIGGRGDIVARFELTPTTEGAVTPNLVIPPAALATATDEDGRRITGLDKLLARRSSILPLIHQIWEADVAKEPDLVGLSVNRIADYLRTLPLDKQPEGPKIAGRDNDFKAALRAWADAGYLEHRLGTRRANLFRPVDAKVVDLFHQDPDTPLDDPPDLDEDDGPELDF